MAKDNYYKNRMATLFEKLERPKKKEPNKRPYMIEITGPPASGKSSTITSLDDHFRREGFRVAVPPEGARVIRNVDRNSHKYNIRTGLYAMELLIDYSENPNFDLVIFDRCMYDVYAWMKYWVFMKNISASRAKEIQTFFCGPPWTDWLDAVFFVIADVEVTAKRKQEIDISEKTGNTSSPEKMKILREIFIQTHHKHRHLKNTFLIDTSNLTKKEQGQIVFEKALSALEKRFDKENHHIYVNLAKELGAEKFATSKTEKIKRNDKLLPGIRSISKRLPEIKIVGDTKKEGGKNEQS